MPADSKDRQDDALHALVGLPGWHIESAMETASHVEIRAAPTTFFSPSASKRKKRSQRGAPSAVTPARTDPETCTLCRGSRPSWASNGHYEVRIHDLPVHGRAAQIVVTRQKFYCAQTGCDALANSMLPGVNEKLKMTERLIEFIQRRYHEVTIAQIVRETGVSRPRVTNVVELYADSIQSNRVVQDVTVVAVDERRSRADGDFVSIVSDGLTGRPIGSAVGRGAEAVEPIFSYLRANHPVQAVSMDFAPAYRSAAEKYLPEAAIVTDKAHALRLVRNERKRAAVAYGKKLKGNASDEFGVFWNLEHVGLKKRMEEDIQFRAQFLSEHPKLQALYGATTRFEAIWWVEWPDSDVRAKSGTRSVPNRTDASAALDDWLASLTGHLKTAFANSIKRFGHGPRSRRNEMLNYFPFPATQSALKTFPQQITNARAEQLNMRLARIEREGRGYSKRSRDAKALLASFRPGESMFKCDDCGTWFEPTYAAPVVILRWEGVEDRLPGDSDELLDSFSMPDGLIQFLDDAGYSPSPNGIIPIPVKLWPPFKPVPANYGICRFCAGLAPEGFERPEPLPEFGEAMKGTRIPTLFGPVEAPVLPTITQRIQKARNHRLERERRHRAGRGTDYIQGDYLDEEN